MTPKANIYSLLVAFEQADRADKLQMELNLANTNIEAYKLLIEGKNQQIETLKNKKPIVHEAWNQVSDELNKGWYA